jgi:hypothetical protein
MYNVHYPSSNLISMAIGRSAAVTGVCTPAAYLFFSQMTSGSKTHSRDRNFRIMQGFFEIELPIVQLFAGTHICVDI